MKLGIAICTYNRVETLLQTIAKVRMHTRENYELVVVDDGSKDNTAISVGHIGVKIITSSNRGIAWNKNRALYYLKVIAKSDIIIVLEDDTFPLEDGWEGNWIRAIARWGHVNLAARYWGTGLFRDGTGTPERPYKSEHVSAQCAGFSSECLENVGYMDSRFRGWGMEHVEHTNRMITAGYGGEPITPIHRPVYYLIDSNLEILHREESVGLADDRKKALIAESIAICVALSHEKSKRDPWINNEEMAIFLSEMNAARGIKTYFYLKDDQDYFMVRNSLNGIIDFVDQGKFSDTTDEKVFSYYDGKVLRLCVENEHQISYLAREGKAFSFSIVTDPAQSTTFDVVLDKVSGMYLYDREYYLSRDRSHGNIATMDRQQASDWERFFFSHFMVIRHPLYPNFRRLI